MAKRFSDTAKWDDDWFVSLSPANQPFWLYLCDKCDHAGLWKISQRIPSALIGQDVNLEEAANAFGDRVAVSNGYWWLVKFCPFQYGKLEESNRVHRSVLALLKAKGILSPIEAPSMPLASPMLGAKDKDIDKDKDKDKNKDKDKDKVLGIAHKEAIVFFAHTWEKKNARK